MRKPSFIRRMTAWLLAAATLLLAALAIGHVIAICQSGLAPENQPSPGVFVRPVFAPEIFSAHLAQTAWAFWLWLTVLAAACAARLLFPAKEKTVSRACAMRLYSAKHEGNSRAAVIRAVLLVAAGLMIVAGMLNGGMWDVLVKAINICTECIGLG